MALLRRHAVGILFTSSIIFATAVHAGDADIADSRKNLLQFRLKQQDLLDSICADNDNHLRSLEISAEWIHLINLHLNSYLEGGQGEIEVKYGKFLTGISVIVRESEGEAENTIPSLVYQAINITISELSEKGIYYKSDGFPKGSINELVTAIIDRIRKSKDADERLVFLYAFEAAAISLPGSDSTGELFNIIADGIRKLSNLPPSPSQNRIFRNILFSLAKVVQLRKAGS